MDDSCNRLILSGLVLNRWRLGWHLFETEAHEVSEEHLDFLPDIANFVKSKLAKTSV